MQLLRPPHIPWEPRILCPHAEENQFLVEARVGDRSHGSVPPPGADAGEEYGDPPMRLLLE